MCDGKNTIGVWPSGKASGSGPVIGGSNPSTPARNYTFLKLMNMKIVSILSLFLLLISSGCNSQETFDEDSAQFYINEEYGYKIRIADDLLDDKDGVLPELIEFHSADTFLPIIKQSFSAEDLTYIVLEVYEKDSDASLVEAARYLDAGENEKAYYDLYPITFYDYSAWQRLSQGTLDYWFVTTVIVGDQYDYRITVSHENEDFAKQKSDEFLNNFELLEEY